MIRKNLFKFFCRLYASLFYKAGSGTFVSVLAEITGKNISFGKNCRILKNSKLDTSANPSNADYLKFTSTGRIAVGNNVTIKDYSLLFSYNGFIEIGDNTTINPFTVIYGHGGVKIGANVMIAANSLIVSANHNFDLIDIPMREQGLTAVGVNIDDDVWIGSNVKILDGVKIGRGCVVASGCVVSKDLEPFGVYAGVPAKLIKNRGLKDGK